MDIKIQCAKKAHQLKKIRWAKAKYPRFPQLIILVVVVTLVGISLLYLTKPTKPSLPNDNPELTTNIQYGLAIYSKYNSVEELATSPEVDVIAHGVIFAAEVFVERPAAEDARASWLVTKFSFQVYWVLKGSGHLKVLEIYQDGGTLDGRTEMMLEDPLMQVGDELILFLHEFNDDSGKYYVEGGPQGRFVVKDGQVFALGEIPVSADERVQWEINTSTKHLHTGGISEVEFIQQIQIALSTN